MKLRYKFVTRNVGGGTVAVAVGTDNEQFNGMVKLNPSGELIFKMLNEGDVTQEQILSAVCAEFGVAEETAESAVLAFIEYLRENELLEE
jgi:hypothetical protein